MPKWGIPGLAIAVVKNGEVVYVEGFGVRDVRSGEPVDENTIFAIGSASKAFTAAAVADLVDKKLLEWDDPVTKYLPGFRVYDPYVTRELTVRDLLSHRSGLLRGDQLWFATELSREEILERVRFQEPTSSFRSQFGYNNNMFLAAGQVVLAETGKTWDEYLREEFFTPLQMERSTTSTLPLSSMQNVAQPHQEIDGEVRAIEWRNIDNIAPAGSINSSAREMTNWLKLQLAKGDFEGREILSEKAIAEMREPHTLIRRTGGWELMTPGSNFMAYGLGWFLNDYRGRKIVHHGGNIDGMHALVAMLPEEELGLVVLTNHNPNFATYALMYRIFDAYLDAPQQDWSRRLLAASDSLRALGRAQERRMEEARVAGTSPSLPLDGYVGSYEDAVHGQVAVAAENGGLVLRWGPRQVADLEHWHYDTFRAAWRDPGFLRIFGNTIVTFTLDPQGRPGKLEIQGVGEFRREPEPMQAEGGTQ
jgi:CubicO group peptidase (beta-lactamase class C family)